MRRLWLVPVVPVLLAALACGPSPLSRREAEADIRQDYPVAVTINVPESAQALKGSPEHARLVLLQEQLGRTGWFSVQRSPDGDRETFAFRLSASAPRDIESGAKGFQIPAAQAEFVRATRMEPSRDSARVTYQIRLVRPTAYFPLFLATHPGVHAGDIHERHAAYRREGRSWILQDTDETLKKAH